MTSFLFCTLTCPWSWILFILFFPSVQVQGIQLFNIYDLAIIYNMSVITRSQAKALLTTQVDLSAPSTDSTHSLLGESLNTASTTIITTPSVIFLMDLTQCTTSSHSPDGDPPYHCTSNSLATTAPSSGLSKFQTSSIVSDNFEISHFAQGATLECTYFENSSYFENSNDFLKQIIPYSSTISLPVPMEDDCDQKPKMDYSSSGLLDITKWLASLCAQITTQNVQLSQEIHQVVQTNDTFKQEVCSEIDELRTIIREMQNPSIQSQPTSGQVTNAIATPPVLALPQGAPASLSTGSASHTNLVPLDQQSQMMLLFADSVSKLSTALGEKSDHKSEWPKFAGDQKKFRAWHLAIMAQLSLPP